MSLGCYSHILFRVFSFDVPLNIGVDLIRLGLVRLWRVQEVLFTNLGGLTSCLKRSSAICLLPRRSSRAWCRNPYVCPLCCNIRNIGDMFDCKKFQRQVFCFTVKNFIYLWSCHAGCTAEKVGWKCSLLTKNWYMITNYHAQCDTCTFSEEKFQQITRLKYGHCQKCRTVVVHRPWSLRGDWTKLVLVSTSKAINQYIN